MMYHSKPYISKIAPRNLNANGKCLDGNNPARFDTFYISK